MPRPKDSPDVAASKTLAYLLRHGAEKESLHMRSDGYVKLNDVLARPKMRGVDVEMILRIVAENAKQRFELFYGYDPSPPVIKPKKGQQKPKNKSLPEGAENGDAAVLDDLRHDLEAAHVSTELPMVSVASPQPISPEALSSEDHGPTEGGDTALGEYFIRATQGHSIKLDGEAHLETVKNDEAGRQKVGEMVHGTKWELYDTIRSTGLSRMARQHIHLAPALTDHQITPRNNSTLLIYLDLEKVIQAGIPVFVSSNGVVLSPGDEQGKIGISMWRKVERVQKGERTVIWENGDDSEP
ncbi:phosphotransferase KptA/Tpt1 [Kockovaella imperatae]|uniref:2'-phosphotransferase n=1 Tax=Kockovaella imperatae TaxID=4999 RepID=A0A1Y1UKP7_9TREE|nr:phosphotransferase KptA/Tpt1 [Kockovaella imperatae]ORX38046.1 phosphotransferase KptA/Tpt1 [Kockovaella imperatae]